METYRANLDQLQSNTRYIFLTVILVILSILGVYLFFQIKNTPSTPPAAVPTPTPEVISEPTVAPEIIPEASPSATGIPIEVPTEIPSNTPTDIPKIITPSVTPSDTPIPAQPTGGEPASSEPVESVEPTPAIQTYDGAADGFTLSYKSDRKVYNIPEPTGHRIAFYRIGGNIAVHVGNGWSWSHPGRVIDVSSSYQISGQPAFRYDIAAQTLVDVKYKDKFYTIQCIHNADESLKSECEQLIISFKFL